MPLVHRAWKRRPARGMQFLLFQHGISMPPCKNSSASKMFSLLNQSRRAPLGRSGTLDLEANVIGQHHCLDFSNVLVANGNKSPQLVGNLKPEEWMLVRQQINANGLEQRISESHMAVTVWSSRRCGPWILVLLTNQILPNSAASIMYGELNENCPTEGGRVLVKSILTPCAPNFRVWYHVSFNPHPNSKQSARVMKVIMVIFTAHRAGPRRQ